MSSIKCEDNVCIYIWNRMQLLLLMGKKHDHNLSLKVEETLKCQINTAIQKQFLKVYVRFVYCCVPRYSIDRNTDLERFFNVDALSGVISTAKPLDREANSVHNLTIFAIESRKFPCGKNFQNYYVVHYCFIHPINSTSSALISTLWTTCWCWILFN